MENLLIVANWKSNKTLEEAKNWLEELQISDVDLENKEVVVCPPFTLLNFLKDEIISKNLPLNLGAQDVSSFGPGSYTGEVNALQLKELVRYVIIGHSERRKNFGEDDSILAQKVSLALSQGLSPIFCISSADMSVPNGVKIVAYEPLDAIGTGNADTPEDAEGVAKKIKERSGGVSVVLYGGSVEADNVVNFTKMENINGVLVGGASLSASSFLEIVKNA